MKKIFLSLTIYFLTLGFANALIEVDITRGNLDPLPIAVSPLHVDIQSENYEGIKVKALGSNISEIIVLGTAHPYKFLETVKKAIGKEINVPTQLSNIVDKEEKFDIIENNISKIKKYILEKSL